MSQPTYPPPAPQGRPHYPPSTPQRGPQPRHGQQQYPPAPRHGHTPAGETSQHYARPPAPVAAPLPAPAAAPRNGLGLAAVIVGLVGLLFGLVPLTGFIAVICALVAIPLGLAGVSRVRKGGATNRNTAISGLILGAGALVLGIWGITIVFGAVDQLANDLSGPAPVGAPAVPGQQLPAAGGAAAQSTAAFGERVTFDNGIAIEVAAPQPYKPGRYAAGHDGDRAVKFDVTVTNGSDESLDAVMMLVNATHDGRQASQVFDSNGGSEPPTGTVLPGKSTTFAVVLSIGEAAADLQVEVTPGFLGEPAIFIGAV
jgi:hypothetical protein